MHHHHDCPPLPADHCTELLEISGRLHDIAAYQQVDWHAYHCFAHGVPDERRMTPVHHTESTDPPEAP